MRKLTIRAIDLLLNPWAQAIWLILLASAALSQTPRYYPPYSEAELLEAIQHVSSVIVVGRSNRSIKKLGLPFTPMPNARLSSFCGLNATACTLYGGTIVVSSRTTMMTIYHELGHIRDTEIEGRTWEESGAHLGWSPSR